MCPAPIAFLNEELKAELGMKSKKDEEEDDVKFCSLKVPIDHEDMKSFLKQKKIYYCHTSCVQ
jgi:hypothetical protein